MTFSTSIPVREIAWNTRDTLQQLAAVIGSTAKLDCFELHLEGDFETARVLLDVSKDLAAKAEASALAWEEETAKLENQANSAEDKAPLSGDVLLNLLKSLMNYLRDGSNCAQLMEVASEIAKHSDSESEPDRQAMKLVAFVVDVLRKDGFDADLVGFVDRPEVVVWVADSSKSGH